MKFWKEKIANLTILSFSIENWTKIVYIWFLKIYLTNTFDRKFKLRLYQIWFDTNLKLRLKLILIWLGKKD